MSKETIGLLFNKRIVMGGENPENELRDNEILLRKKKINTSKGIEDGIGLYERDLNGNLKNITQYSNLKDKVYTKEDYPRSTNYKTNKGYYTGDAIIRSLIDHSSSLEEDEVMIEQTYHIDTPINTLEDWKFNGATNWKGVLINIPVESFIITDNDCYFRSPVIGIRQNFTRYPYQPCIGADFNAMIEKNQPFLIPAGVYAFTCPIDEEGNTIPYNLRIISYNNTSIQYIKENFDIFYVFNIGKPACCGFMTLRVFLDYMKSQQGRGRLWNYVTEDFMKEHNMTDKVSVIETYENGNCSIYAAYYDYEFQPLTKDLIYKAIAEDKELTVLYDSMTDKDNYSYYSPHAVTMQELGLAEAYNHFYPNSPIATQASEVENKPVVMSLDEQEDNNDNESKDDFIKVVKVEDNEDFIK